MSAFIEKNTSAIELARAINGLLWLAIENNPATDLVTESLIYTRNTLSGINHEHSSVSQKQKMLNQDNIDKAITLMRLLALAYPAHPAERIACPVLENIDTLLRAVHFGEANGNEVMA